MAVTQKRRIKRGPNKGDLVVVKARNGGALQRGEWWPIAVLEDVGNNSTLRDNPGVRFGKKKKKR